MPVATAAARRQQNILVFIRLLIFQAAKLPKKIELAHEKAGIITFFASSNILKSFFTTYGRSTQTIHRTLAIINAVIGVVLYHFVGIVLIVAQNLLNVDNFWAGVPCNAAAHQVPIIALLGRNLFK
jgi:hypothetical protein